MICVVGIFSSCSSDEDIEKMNGTKSLLNYAMDFVYQGESYSYQVIDGKLFCSDDRTEKMVKELQENTQLITFVHEDGHIEYFNEEEYANFLNNKKEKMTLKTSIVEQRGIGIPTDKERFYATMKLYEDKNYKGASVTYQIEGANNMKINSFPFSWGITALKLDLINALPPLLNIVSVRFYNKVNLSGYSLYYETSNSLSVDSFVGVPLYPGSTENWNDNIRSVFWGQGYR